MAWYTATRGLRTFQKGGRGLFRREWRAKRFLQRRAVRNLRNQRRTVVARRAQRRQQMTQSALAAEARRKQATKAGQSSSLGLLGQGNKKWLALGGLGLAGGAGAGYYAVRKRRQRIARSLIGSRQASARHLRGYQEYRQ